MSPDAEIVAFHRYVEEENGRMTVTLTISARESIGMTGVVNDPPDLPEQDTQD